MRPAAARLLPLCALALLLQGCPEARAGGDAGAAAAGAHDAAPAAAPPPGAAATDPAPAPVRVHGRAAFELRAPRGGASAKERARAAEPILQQLVDGQGPLPDVSVVAAPGGEAQLRAGDRVVITIGPADAAATGLAPAEYQSSLRAQLESFLQRERRRARLQEAVLSVSLAVFFGLLTLLGLRWVGRRGAEAQDLVVQRAATLRGLRVRNVIVLSPQAVESAAYLGIGAARALAQVGMVYAYLAYTLSQFAATRGFVAPLTSLLTSPFTVLAERLGRALPGAVLLVASVLLVRSLLRVAGFFFDHVARGEVRAAWLPAGTASAARPLVLSGLALLLLLSLAPLVSGDSDGVLARAGLLALGLLGLAAVPLLAAVAVGAAVIFTGRLRLGEWIRIGPHCGEVAAIGFLDVTLVPLDAGRVRVPHLICLLRAVRHLPGPPPLRLEVPLPATHAPAEVTAVLERAAAPFGAAAAGVEARLIALAGAEARYEVTLRDPRSGAGKDALPALLSALQAAGLGPGQRGGG